ncbi:MAG TPA: DUF2252 domain-containing protein [Candidatus Eremiobacteraceae bacterium]|nr:DUF2252 domain-containing protein [Candidatus Eremiobacteraceae bacterium]
MRRTKVPRSSHAEWEPSSRRDPIGLLIESNATRVPELVPIRYGRMAISPFAFYRGAAALMAYDLKDTPASGINAQICGDAHLSNFGLFGTPERRIIFDVNDFDETRRGPWEWDLKRLAASCFIAARDNGARRRQSRLVAQASVAAYRGEMQAMARLGYLDIWYTWLDLRRALEIVPRSYFMAARDRKRQAIHRTSSHGLPSFVVKKSGEFRIQDERPLITHINDAERSRRLELDIIHYRDTLEPDRQTLLSRYHLVDLATKVVGVGSVGTRCYVALFVGRDNRDTLLLQIKEAQASVLEPYLGKSRYTNHGERVVHGQRLMQAASDIFLGWARGLRHDYYVRQLRDEKYGAAVQAMGMRDLIDYADLCGRALARAHARSGDPSEIAGYLGQGATFDRALAEFAETYGEQNERDYAALLHAIKTKQVKAKLDL